MPDLQRTLLAPGNSAQAVDLITEMLERCRQCRSQGCPGLGELLILATVQSAMERCDEEACKRPQLDGLLPGPEPAVG
jgi:hypothetical protein